MRIFIALAALVLSGPISPGTWTGLASSPSKPAAPGEPAPPGSVVLERLTWTEAQKRLTRDGVVVIPIGGAAVEHGPHLPLGTDRIVIEHLRDRLLAHPGTVIAPTLSYYDYRSFAGYAGSTSLSEATSRDAVVDICESLAHHGPHRFYALTTARSAGDALQAAEEMLATEGIVLRHTDVASVFRGLASDWSDREPGPHAGDIDTSLMLYLEPSSVNLERTAALSSSSGIWGDPSHASSTKGQRVLDALVVRAGQDIEDLRRTSLPSARQRQTVQRQAPVPNPLPGDPGQGTGSEGDDREIRLVAARYQTAWMLGDAWTLARLWTDDGDIAHPGGLFERGVETIAANRAALFARREYSGSVHRLSLGTIRFLRRDIAVADGKWELSRVRDQKGQLLPPTRGQCTWVMARQGGEWKIASYRYTTEIAQPTPGPQRDR